MLHRSPSRALLAIAFVILLVATACGGDDGGSSGDTDATDAPTTEAESGDASSESTGNDELDALRRKQQDATFKVTYRDQDGTEWTWAQDPPRSSYRSGDSITIATGDDTSVQCSGLDSEPTCIELPSELGLDALTTGFFGIFGGFFLGDDVPGVERTDDREILDRPVTCASYDPGAALDDALGALDELGGDLGELTDTGTITVCVDDETGVLMLGEVTGGEGDDSRIEAIEFDQPTDADFEPPAEPTALDEQIPGFDPENPGANLEELLESVPTSPGG